MLQVDTVYTEDEQDVILFWKGLFPELKTIDELEKIFLTLYDKSLKDLLLARELEEEEQNKYIDEIMLFNKIDGYRDIKQKYYSDFKWIGFFKPLLLKYDGALRAAISDSKIVKDIEGLVDSIYRQMLQEMINKSFRVIVVEINLAREDGLLIGEDPEARYRYFFEELIMDKEYQSSIYSKYPELIHILDKYIKNTIDYVKEILEHTEREKVSLFHQMRIDGPLLLEEIKFSLGDSHNGNKTVAKLLFEQDFILMYKPRPLEIEKAYRLLVEWLAAKIPTFKKPYAANVYTKDHYGYMEYIKRNECSDQESIQNYYYKMGELVAILYSLNSKDFHGENIIADNEDPVLIDLETLLHKVEQLDEKEISSYMNIYSEINNSVAGISILPTTIINRKENLVMEVGAMNSGKKRKSPYKTQMLEGRNTDYIHIKNVYKEIDVVDSSPKYQGEYVSADQYITYIKEGFISTYQWIFENKKEYYKEVERLFAKIESRYIYRSTNNYTQLLESGYHPDLLHNKMDRYVYFHRAAITVDFENNQADANMCKSEIREMLRCDIPMYKVKNDSTDILNMDNKMVMQANGDTILTSIQRRLEVFSKNDLKRQVSLINQCFMGSGLTTDVPDKTETIYKENNKIIENTDGLDMAVCLTNSMIERGIRNKSRQTMSWIGMKGYGNKYYENLPLELDLYQGNAGIAILLISMYKTTHEELYKTTAIESLNYVMEYMEEADMKDLNLGAFSGVYGALYAISLAVKANILSDNTSFVNFIIRKIEESEEHLENVDELDIISGLSGILGTLVTMKQILTNDYPQHQHIFNRLIEKVANRIEEFAIYVDEDSVMWNENFDSGYAHGSAGIITQLLRCFQDDGDHRKLELIRKGLNYERKHLFDQRSMKWKIRENSNYFSWCNGIGGLLLSKVFFLTNGIEEEQLKLEINLLIEQLKVYGFGYDKSLCHGDLGSLILLDYANVSNDKDKTRAYENLIYEVSSNYKNVKDQLSFEIEDWGLMTGTSGVVLSLLKNVGTVDIAKLLLLDDPNIGGQ